MSMTSSESLSRSFSNEGFFLGLDEELESLLDLTLSGLLEGDERFESTVVPNCDKLP